MDIWRNCGFCMSKIFATDGKKKRKLDMGEQLPLYMSKRSESPGEKREKLDMGEHFFHICPNYALFSKQRA